MRRLMSIHVGKKDPGCIQLCTKLSIWGNQQMPRMYEVSQSVGSGKYDNLYADIAYSLTFRCNVVWAKTMVFG